MSRLFASLTMFLLLIFAAIPASGVMCVQPWTCSERSGEPPTTAPVNDGHLGFVDGPNLYAYVKQNPWTGWDPEGLATVEDYQKKIGNAQSKMDKLSSKGWWKMSRAEGKEFEGLRGTIGDAQSSIAKIEATAAAISETTGSKVSAHALDDSWDSYKSFRNWHFVHNLNPEAGVGDQVAQGNYSGAAKTFAKDTALALAAEVGARALFKGFGMLRSGAANSGARIGATGKIGETALKQLGGDPQVFFNTSQGGRYVDQLVNGIANEAKVGYQTLTPGMRLQVMKDVELIQTQQVQGAIWNFYRSPVTGKIGPSGPLGDLLNSNNIPFTLHY